MPPIPKKYAYFGEGEVEKVFLGETFIEEIYWGEYIPIPDNVFTVNIATDNSSTKFRITGLAGTIIQWGDGTIDAITGVANQVMEHQYAIAGQYEIGIPDSVTKIWLINNQSHLSIDGDQLPDQLDYLYGVFSGVNEFTVDYAELPDSLTNLNLMGEGNKLTGDVANAPRGLETVYLSGMNMEASGDASGLPPNLEELEITGVKLNAGLTGSLSDMPTLSGLYHFALDLPGTLTASDDFLLKLPNVIDIVLAGDNFSFDVNITTLFSIVPDSVEISGGMSMSGDMGKFSDYGDILLVPATSTVTYTHEDSTGKEPYSIYYEPGSGGLTTAEVDQFLIDLSVTASAIDDELYIYLTGDNAFRSEASDAAVAIIEAVGEVVVNGVSPPAPIRMTITSPTIPTFANSKDITIIDNGDGTWVILSSDNNIIFTNTDITEVVCHKGDGLDYQINMFKGLSKVTSIIFEAGWDTSTVTSMYDMFNGCLKLETLDISHFDTSKVTNMHGMFSGCKKIAVLDLDHFNLSQCTDTSDMFLFFGSETSMASFSFNNKDMSKVNSVKQMFYGMGSPAIPCAIEFKNNILKTCEDLFKTGVAPAGTIDVTGCDTSAVKIFDDMFSSQNKLTAITGLGGLDTSAATSMIQMFSNCTELTTLDVSNFDTANVTKVIYMFNNCQKVTSLDVSNFNTAKVAGTGMNSIFVGCWALESIDVSNFNTSKLTAISSLFGDCKALTTIDISNFDLSLVTNMTRTFKYCDALKSVVMPIFAPTANMGYMFRDCISLECVNALNTTNATEKEEMFLECAALTQPDAAAQADLIDADGSNWVNPNPCPPPPPFYMIVTSPNIPVLVATDGTLDITDNGDGTWSVGSFDPIKQVTFTSGSNNDVTAVVCYGATTSMTDMTSMFKDMLNLTSVVFEAAWDTSLVTSMASMLSGCKLLTTLDMSNFDTSEVTDFNRMFMDCWVLPEIDLTILDTSKATDISFLLKSCKKILYADTVGFDMSLLPNVHSVFRDCLKLKCITGFNTAGNPTNAYLFITTPALVAPDSTDQAAIIAGTNWVNPEACPIPPMFEMTVTCPTPPTFSVMDGSVVVVDNGDGTWNVSSCYQVKRIQFLNTAVTAVVCHRDSSILYLDRMFKDLDSLASVVFEAEWTTPIATSALGMFQGCTMLSSVDISMFDISKIQNFSNMFDGCSALTNLVLPAGSTPALKSISQMFKGCSSLPSIDLSTFDFTLVEGLKEVFLNCSAMTFIKIPAGSAGYDVTRMFSGCSSLLCISMINTEGAAVKTGMFNGCGALVQPDATAKADLIDGDGADWTNPNACP